MESFSLLKYWRGGGGGRGVLAPSISLPEVHHSSGTLGATVLRCAGEAAALADYGDVDDDDGDDCSSSTSAEGDDEGPFFDLEFAVPDDDDDSSGVVGVMDGLEDGGEGVRAGEFGFAVEAAAASSTQSDGSVGMSPSHDDLFFKGRLVPLETASSATTTTSLVLAEGNSRQHQFLPVSTLLKSATRFRVFAMGLKKGTGAGGGSSNSCSSVAKSSGAADTGATVAVPSPKHPHHSTSNSGGGGGGGGSSKFFTVKYLKVVEEVPIMSLFSRDNSSRSNSSRNKTTTTAARQSSSSDLESTITSSSAGTGAGATAPGPSVAGDEKKSSKEQLVHKYLNKIKPLYVRVSRRHADKLEQQQHHQMLRSSPGHQQAKTSAAAATTTAETVEAAKDSVDSSTPVADGAGAAGDQKPQTVGAASTSDTGTSEKQLQMLSTAASKPTTTTTTQKEKVASVSASAASQHLQAGIRVVCKHLGKSRSASSAAVAAAPSPPPSVATRRRDDSLLQQQDGIQSAIAHCKRSFNATRADNNMACSPTTAASADLPPPPPTALPLSRSRSDPCDEQWCSGGAELVA